MKYFYTDPLAAAWMANKFMMEFVADDGREIIITDLGFDFKNPTALDRSPRKAFISPDSLHILGLCEGDLGIDINGQIQRYDTEWSNPFIAILPMRVIYRNGTPFMWPEVEA